MKLSDALSGFLTLIVGVAIVTYARTFPPMSGQDVGPSLFPTIIGGAMALFGAMLVFSGARTPGASWIELDEWVRRPRTALNFALIVAAVVFYALAVDWLGFFMTAFAFLATLFFTFGVTRKWIVPLAAVVTIVIHYGFYTLLRVPLPWGVLGGIAW